MEPSTRDVYFDLDSHVKKEEAYITTYHTFNRFLVSDSIQGLEEKWNEGQNWEQCEFLISSNENLVSPEIKVLIYVSGAFYHFFIDSLAIILKLHKQHPGARLILYLDKYEPNKNYDKILSFLFKLLDHLNVKYSTVPTSPGYNFAPVYKFSNFVVIDESINIHNEVTLVDVKYAADVVIDYLTGGASPLPEPTKKVYISRGIHGVKLGDVSEDYVGYKDDLRIYEPDKLENVLIENGYEIVHPESKFETIEEQILFMLEVKSLVAVTCSGLTNVIFMQPEQNVIEIQSEVVQVKSTVHTGDGSPPSVTLMQSIHNYYPPLSFMRGVTHTCIPTERDPEVAIERMRAAGLIK